MPKSMVTSCTSQISVHKSTMARFRTVVQMRKTVFGSKGYTKTQMLGPASGRSPCGEDPLGEEEGSGVDFSRDSEDVESDPDGRLDPTPTVGATPVGSAQGDSPGGRASGSGSPVGSGTASQAASSWDAAGVLPGVHAGH